MVAAVKRWVVSRTHRRQHGAEERLVVSRDRDRAQPAVVKVDDDRSKAVPETPLGECARVATAAHRLDACRQSSQSEAGVADDEVRLWRGGPPHHTRS